LPDGIGARFESAQKLTDEDRKLVTDLASATLGPFHAKTAAASSGAPGTSA
jgi:hypothetical protein